MESKQAEHIDMTAYQSYVRNLRLPGKCVVCGRVAMYCDAQGIKVSCRKHASPVLKSTMRLHQKCIVCMFIGHNQPATHYARGEIDNRCDLHKESRHLSLYPCAPQQVVSATIHSADSDTLSGRIYSADEMAVAQAMVQMSCD